MAPSAGTSSPRGAPRRGVVAIVVVSFVAVLLGAIVFGSWESISPPGVLVATSNLLAADAQTLVDVRQGDRLRFRTDVETYPMRLKALGSALRECTFEVLVEDPTGREERARCALFSGPSVVGHSSSDGAYYRGMLNECVVPIAANGQHTVRARVEWSSALSPTAARLEIRRVPAKP